MRFNLSAAAILAFTTSVFAQTTGFDSISQPATGDDVHAGKSFQIKWSVPDKKYDNMKVDIALLGGADPAHLVKVGMVATGVNNGDLSFDWNVDSQFGEDAVYGLTITSESDSTIMQYSQPFKIKAHKQGGGGGHHSHSTTTSMTTTSEHHTTTSNVTTTSMPTTTPATTSGYNCTTTPSGMITTTVAPQPSSTVPPEQPAPSSPAGTKPPTGAAGHVAAGSMALVGGIVAAILAL